MIVFTWDLRQFFLTTILKYSIIRMKIISKNIQFYRNEIQEILM